MAITLDELLGRNMTTEKTTEIFPSYEEFASARNAATRTAERNDSFGATSGYGYYSAPSQQRYEAQRYEADVYQPRYNDNTYSNDIIQPARQQSFYDYVAHNTAGLDDADLYNRLSRTNGSMRPAFGSNEVSERSAQKTAQATGVQQKTRGRLNTKGKLIVGSFLAVVVTVMSLIIAYASKINSGTAVVPASNAAASAASVSTVL